MCVCMCVCMFIMYVLVYYMPGWFCVLEKVLVIFMLQLIKGHPSDNQGSMVMFERFLLKMIRQQGIFAC